MPWVIPGPHILLFCPLFLSQHASFQLPFIHLVHVVLHPDTRACLPPQSILHRDTFRYGSSLDAQTTALGPASRPTCCKLNACIAWHALDSPALTSTTCWSAARPSTTVSFARSPQPSSNGLMSIGVRTCNSGKVVEVTGETGRGALYDPGSGQCHTLNGAWGEQLERFCCNQWTPVVCSTKESEGGRLSEIGHAQEKR